VLAAVADEELVLGARRREERLEEVGVVEEVGVHERDVAGDALGGELAQAEGERVTAPALGEDRVLDDLHPGVLRAELLRRLLLPADDDDDAGNPVRLEDLEVTPEERLAADLDHGLRDGVGDRTESLALTGGHDDDRLDASL